MTSEYNPLSPENRIRMLKNSAKALQASPPSDRRLERISNEIKINKAKVEEISEKKKSEANTKTTYTRRIRSYW